MKEYIIILALSILFVLLAFAGMAIKSFFNKTPSLRGCGGSGDKGGCGCSNVSKDKVVCASEIS
ncbi:MAG TPA: hypothetical protein VJ855_00950 [Marinilabiliaceae bacterium]|nr:hypothetical protein [Marinilabiliaceae bacterium]